MKTMRDFYNSLPSTHAIRVAYAEHSTLSKVFEEEDTGGTELPDFLAATTRLRSELEDVVKKPAIVTAYIGLLDADVRMMRAIINGTKGEQ